MARHFVDTACVVKLYRAEPNSPIVMALFAPGDELVVSELATVEFRSAMYGLVRQGLLTPPQAAIFVADFTADLPSYEIVEMERKVILLARTLIETWSATNRLRTLDSLQLASALQIHRAVPIDTFITTDAVLAGVAIAEGLTVKP